MDYLVPNLWGGWVHKLSPNNQPLEIKNDVLACITEPSSNEYDNDGSDNDYNFGSFDDFDVEMVQDFFFSLLSAIY